jgi:hypothetical protein
MYIYHVTVYDTVNRGMMGGSYDNSKLISVEADHVEFDGQHVTFSRIINHDWIFHARYNNVLSVVRIE